MLGRRGSRCPTLVLSLAFAVASLSPSEATVRQQTFEALDLPADYWQALGMLEEAAYGTREACAFGCLEAGPACMAYEFDTALSTCAFGSVVVPADVSNNYIPDYVMDRKRVLIRKELLSRGAVTDVAHLGFIPHSGDTNLDAAFEDARFGPVAMEDPPVGPPYFAVLSYQDGFIVCGGLKGTTVDKKCRCNQRLICTVHTTGHVWYLDRVY